MQIKLKNQYKSLYPFESENLSDFSVITGKNGSGKSQLLELLYYKSQNRAEVNQIDISIIPYFNKIQFEGISKQSAFKINHDEWKKSLKKTVDLFIVMPEEEKRFHAYMIENNLIDKILANNYREVLLSEDEYCFNLIEQIIRKKSLSLYYSHREQNPKIQKQVTVLNSTYFQKNILKAILLAKEVAAYLEKKFFDLKEHDFYTTPISEYWVDENDLFQSKLEIIFYNYSRRRHKNDYEFYRKEKYKIPNSSISDLDFIKRYPEPWKTINDILEKYNIDFYFKGLEPGQFTEDVNMDNPLHKKSTETQILFENLSSGEKVVIGLILKLFLSDYYEGKLEYPNLLLLDEPDAHLHPEMSKLLIDILNEVFVKQLGIKVIFSTHSPSTIALCPDDCIYQLENGENTQLKKISKDIALELLTSFIPTLSINYKNHKQVFVESPTDVMYYQGLHDKHLQSNKLDYRLYFISNGYGKSNCDHVYKIVEELRKSGNDTSFGIVDWDLANKPNENILVHGLNERYSVENFILDPIYIYCLLIDMGDAHKTSERLGLELGFNQYLLGYKSETELQRYVDLFFEDFTKKYPAFNTNGEKVEWKYLNEKKLLIPKEYSSMQGHEIVTKIKEIYPAFGKFNNEGDLQKALYPIILKCYPFVPISTIKIIESLSKN
ncbi:ATP-dependent endonuclease [Dysgonomonas sp. BGC7]|uniref:ATP-dependent nuclease n=1 Tax=Dysgonomonas sp. BGC7 TaxID=1658008 RepID=UPI000681A1ED|nr:AAA family ATPase [Dysgonomonas sp. BGC7]MBD8387912.1 AAA family ATPase [Dysgonomonas sp. BGC7]